MWRTAAYYFNRPRERRDDSSASSLQQGLDEAMHSYPWYSNIRHLFLTNKKKLSHAQILYGGDKVGRNTLILDLCQTLLCQNIASDLNPCNECQACHWFARASHPDFYLIDDTGETNNISIEVIRELKDFFELSSHQQDGLKIAVIMNAENLTNASANALLKILEEPPNNCFIFLTTSNLNQVLPTLRSRSQLISLPNPSPQQIKAYVEENKIVVEPGQLEFSNNAMDELVNDDDRYRLVVEIIDELKKGKSIRLTNITTRWLEFGLPWFVDVMQKWVYEIFLSKMTNRYCYFPLQKTAVSSLASNSSLQNLLSFQKKINEIKMYAAKPVNKDLNLDLILMEYKKIFN